MTYFIVAYFLFAWCMYNALPYSCPVWRQIQLSLTWPMTMVTAIFVKLMRYENV
jgi:hypothetical protein